MTREEAIHFANCLKNNYTIDLNDMQSFCDMAIKALEQEPTTKNNLGVDCVARQDVERYIEGFINEYTPKEELEFINLELDGLKHIPSVTPQLSVPEVTALAEWTEKLTKASEDAYNKGYADGVKSVNICPHCGEYIGEEV